MTTGEQRRDSGIGKVAANNAGLILWAVERAKALPLGKRFLVEDLRKRCPIAATHHNAWGAVGRALVRSGFVKQVGWVKAKSDLSNARRMPQYERIEVEFD